MTYIVADMSFLVWPKANQRWEQQLRSMLPHVEALWNRVQLAVGDRDLPRPVYTVAGLNSGDGASTTAAALCYYLSEGLGMRTLLVEANLRRPSLLNQQLSPRCPGLVGVLEQQARLKHVVFELTRVGFFVLPAGHEVANPSGHLQPTFIADFLDAALPHFDAIVFDAPALSSSPETRHLIAASAATIPVLRAGVVTPDFGAYWLGKIADYGGQIGAVCLNDVETILPTWLRARM